MDRYFSKAKQSRQLAKNLRKNMTKEERHLWYDYLHVYKPAFRRQFVIADYIVDFYCPAVRLAIELDGSQHYEADEMQKDKLRTERIEALGVKVIRYMNTDVRCRFREVCEDIDRIVKDRSSVEGLQKN